MSTDSSLTEELPIQTIFETELEESSEEPPMDEWSSLNIGTPDENKKPIRYENSLYPRASEVCAEYICMSASSVLRHQYYHYPSIRDPGITSALLEPEEKIQYPDNGQELYLAICKEMNQYPVRLFYRGLLEEEINLQYYCVNGVRAMALALKYNKIVKIFDLTDNFLDKDSCYHLGEIFISNSSLSELILSGCRIGHEGVKLLLAGLQSNMTLKVLNLNRNQLGDIGMEYIAQSIFLGLSVHKLYLSNNNIGAKGVVAFTEALETHNKLHLLDLSWNNLYVPATNQLLSMLGESVTLKECNLSWNGISNMGFAIKALTRAPNLRTLNLSNNRLAGNAVVNLMGNLGKAMNLVTLDLSYNPLSPNDALNVINKLNLPDVKVQRVILDNIYVNPEFLEILENMKCMKSKQRVVVTHGGVVGTFQPTEPDMREIVLNRIEFLTQKPKKNKVDFALFILQLLKDNNNILILPTKIFMRTVAKSGASLDEDLFLEMTRLFAGPSTEKSKTIDINRLADYIQRKWPDRKLPPTPPPEPEPIKPKRKKGKKGKK